jgi:hypothetical protein
MRRGAAIVAVLGLAVLGARPVRAQEGLAPILARLESAHDVSATVQALLQAVDGKAEPLFAALCAPECPRLAATALELALEQLPDELTLAPLRKAARSAHNDAEREAALALLARTGTRDEVALALELGAADEPDSAAPNTRVAELRRALRGILAREPQALATLDELCLRADASTRETVLRVLGESSGENAAARLAAMLWRADGDTKALLLVEIARAAGRGSGRDDPAVSEQVRAELGSLDRSLTVLACGALERLQDHSAVEDLIVLLADPDANVARRAHTALGRLTGLELAADEDAWLGWLAESFAWWDTRSEACRVALVSGTPAEAAAAIGEVARQRFRRDHVVQTLELALRRPEGDLVELALAALSAIPDPRAQLALQRFRDEARASHAESVDTAQEKIDRRMAATGRRPNLRPPAKKRTP